MSQGVKGNICPSLAVALPLTDGVWHLFMRLVQPLLYLNLTNMHPFMVANMMLATSLCSDNVLWFDVVVKVPWWVQLWHPLHTCHALCPTQYSPGTHVLPINL